MGRTMTDKNDHHEIDHNAETTDSPPDLPGDATVVPGIPPSLPEKIGHYAIKSRIGSGGMADVYLAMQEHPRRKVALKLMRTGIASRSALRRFEFESQILGRLHHPNIAQVYEAGTHDDGSGGVPYFAMEYIPNAKSITDYAREKKLSTKQRLDLFAKVCDAVHHGHQKAIIHRDLKPGNILVDSSGEPKVIDFGVARSTDSDMVVTTLQTDVGQLIGTLQYMSPEQCEADPDDLDTRSDVYALGVVLYELLCDQLPYDVTKVAVYEAARVVREELPAKLSTINRALRGDVETITLKALEKERERRYKSAEALGDDIHKFLSDEPIVARRPSTWYQLSKFSKRNKALVGGVAAVLLVSVIGTVVSFTFAVGEAEQRVRAEREADNAKEINNFLTDDLLASVAPSAESGKGKDVLMRDVLDVASDKIEEASQSGGRFADKPLIEASIRATLGETYLKLGEYPSAEPHLERASELYRRELGEEHPNLLDSMNDLGRLYNDQGRYDEVEPLYVKTLEIRKRVLGAEHPNTLDSMNNLAILYDNQGRYDEAEPLYVKTLEIRKRVLGAEHPNTLDSMNNLALLYAIQGRYDEAESLYVKTLEISKRVLGEKHPDTLGSMGNLAVVYKDQGRYDEAEPLYLKTLEIMKRVLGEEHPNTVRSMHNLAVLYDDQDRYDQAEPLYVEALEIKQRVLGEEHPTTLFSMFNLAELYVRQERFEEAEALQTQAVNASRRVWPEGTWYIGLFLGSHGETLGKLHRYRAAEEALEEAYEILMGSVGPENKYTIRVVEWFTDLYDAWHEAEPNKGYDTKADQWRAKLPADETDDSEPAETEPDNE